MSQSTKTIGVVLHGATGRMGRAIARQLGTHTDLSLMGTVELRTGAIGPTNPALPLVDPESLEPGQHVVVDFSQPAAIAPLIESLTPHRVSLVSGTTGLAQRERDLLNVYSKGSPVFYDENMSYGIAVLRTLLRTGRRLLPHSRVEIVETHHSGKRDIPSGTALSLAKAAAPDREVVTGRAPDTESKGVHIHSIRLANVPGDHSVVLDLEDELLTLSHRAITRDVFAKGALRAAQFVVAQKNGMYSMADLTRTGDD